MSDRRNDVEDGAADRADVAAAEPPEPELDDVLSYEDGDVVVVCARSNPEAWIESDHLLRLRE